MTLSVAPAGELRSLLVTGPVPLYPCPPPRRAQPYRALLRRGGRGWATGLCQGAL